MTTDDPRPFPPRPGADSDEIDEVFGGANPNPERIGCPPQAELERLARKRSAIDDPLYEHLASCSPCFREWRAAMQVAAQPSRTAANTRSLLGQRLLALAALLAALTLAGLLWWNWKTTVQNGPATTARHDPAPETIQSLDLRPYAASRGGATSVTRPLLLRRGVMRITMILPVGAEPGPYDIQILDKDLHSRITTVRADGELRDQTTLIHTTLDLSALPEGTYQLALRRDDQDWRFFPAEVQAEQPTR